MNPIQPFSTWRYVGKEPGHGELHSVVFVHPQEIVTVSMRNAFLGTAEEFLSQFQFVMGAKP